MVALILDPRALLARTRALAQGARVRGTRARERAVFLLRRYLPSESQHLFALTLAVGVVCGFVAVAFHLAIGFAERMLIDRAMHTPGVSGAVWTVLSPALGGLFAGLMLTYVVPNATGSGIPQVKAAFALEGGRIRFRDAVGKFWVAVLQIGSGASLGREGPTVQICAGATSLLARLTALPAKNMRRLLPVGVAAGIAAAFNAPIAAVTFTIEEIVGSLDHAVLSGVVVAAALAAVIERGVLGVHPIIEVQQPYGLDHSSSLVFYALLGVAGGAVSVLFTDGLLKVRAAFRSLDRVPRWARPSIGGLVTGLLAVAVFKFLGTSGVTGGGYETLGKALDGRLAVEAMLVLCVAKLIATVFSYSSGGAGGIFAPALFIGAMLGGSIGQLDVALFGHEARQVGAFALVGMGAVFAGVIRAPITSVLIIFEMTGGYGLVLPLMLANMTAYVLARRIRPTPIYEALLEQDGIVLPRAEVSRHALEQLTAGDAMTREVISVEADQTVAEVVGGLTALTFQVVPVLSAQGGPLGVIPLALLRHSPPEAKLSTLVTRAETVLANASLTRAVVRMSEAGVRHLLVLDEKTASRLVGVLTISDLVRAHARAVPEGAPLRPAAASDGAGELRAADLARPAQIVAQSATVDEVLGAMARSHEAVVVRAPDGSNSGCILLEHLREFLEDERLQRMLVAADLSRPLGHVPPETGLEQLVETFARDGADALVLDAPAGAPLLLVTRTAMGAGLLEWYARSKHARGSLS